jgi:Arc/MetJ family transcription regulator
MVIRYKGVDEFEAWMAACDAESDQGGPGTISPGGAAMLLGVTRSRVNQLIAENADIRAYAFHELMCSTKAGAVEISVRDLVRWGVSRGKRAVEDYGFFFARLQRALDLALQLEAELAAVRLSHDCSSGDRSVPVLGA